LLAWLGDGSLLDAHHGTDTVIFSPSKQGWQSRLVGFGPAAWQGTRAFVAVSADGQRLAGVPANTDGKTVGVWDLAHGKRLNDLPEHTGQVTSIAWSPNGERLACFSTTGEVVVWDAQVGIRLHQAQLWPSDHSSNWSLLSWSPDGKLLAVSSHDGVVRLCDEELRVRQELTGHDDGYNAIGVAAMQWGENSDTLQTADAKRIRRWETSSGKLLAVTSHGLPNQATPPLEWQFSSDGERLVTTGSAARVWDTSTGGLQASLVALHEGQCAVVSNDGHHLGTPLAANDLVYVVQRADGQELLSPQEFAAMYGWQNDPGKVKPP
jgi:WD40 repeat protein